jgi:hypothetical protein
LLFARSLAGLGSIVSNPKAGVARPRTSGEFKDVLNDLSMLRRTRFDGNFIIKTFVPRAESIVTAIVEVFIAIGVGLLYKVER